MNLYGQDMDEIIFLFEVNMGWIIIWEFIDCKFVGCDVFEVQCVVGIKKLVGLVMKEKGVLCVGLKVKIEEGEEGIIIFGIFFLILGYVVVMVCIFVINSSIVEVEMCKKWVKVEVVKFSFVCNGKSVL